MKIKTDELLKALNALKLATSSKGIMEQTDCFIFLENEIITYNDEILISVPFETGIKGAIKTDVLLQYLNKCKASEIDVEVNENELIIKNRKAKAGFVVSEIILPFSNIKIPDKFNTLPENFINNCKTVKFTAAKDMTMGILTNIHVTENFIESCDNFRITRIECNCEEEFLIREADINNLIAANLNPVFYKLEKEWIHFKNENNITFSCRRIEGDYPDTTAFLSFAGKKVQLPKSVFDLIQKASVFAIDDFKVDSEILIKLEDGKINIESKNKQGWFKEQTRIKYNGDVLEFSINPFIFEEAINKFDEIEIADDRIAFENDTIKHVISLG